MENHGIGNEVLPRNRTLGKGPEKHSGFFQNVLISTEVYYCVVGPTLEINSYSMYSICQWVTTVIQVWSDSLRRHLLRIGHV